MVPAVGVGEGLEHFQLDLRNCGALSSTLRREFRKQGKFLAAVAEARDNPEEAQEIFNVPAGMLMAMMG